MLNGKLFFEKRIIAAAVIYFLVSGIFLFKYGIQLGGEAEKYIDNAGRILHGQELRNGVFGIFYFSYSVIVAFFTGFNINLVFVAILQVLLSFIAALSLYKVLLLTLDNRRIAFIFFCVYLLCYPIQKWNFFLYSESVHTSFLVIATYLFLKAINGKKRSAWIGFGIMSLAVLFSRPVGIIFLLSVLFVSTLWLYRNNKKTAALVVSLLSVAGIIGICNSPLASFINPDSIKRMEVICQVPEANTGIEYREFNKAGLYKAYTVIKEEIGVGNFFRTGFKKLGSFFGQYRSYYSWQNNGLLLLYCILYPFAFLGIFFKQGRAFSYIKWLSVSYLALTSMAIFFTCDDWANRFISPAFPFILILAAGGCTGLFKRSGSSGRFQ